MPAAASDEEVINLPPLEQPRKGNPKLDSWLNYLITAETPEKAARFLHKSEIEPVDGNIRIIVECAPGQVDAAIEASIALGAKVETSHRAPFQVSVPVTRLTALADTPTIRFARLPRYGEPYLISQGAELINSDEWYAAGYTGAGVKVAILDLGFGGYTDLLGTELPDVVTTRSFRGDGDIGGGTEHGTACAEIVHDIAPDAQLYLVNYHSGAEMRDAVDWLISEEVDIISHSCGSSIWGPGDGTGEICQKVEEARTAGIVWTQAMGNYGKLHWQGEFIDTDGDGNNEFSQSPFDETIAIYAETGEEIRVRLKWDDPWGASANDYRLCLLDKNLNLLFCTINVQNGSGDPVEGFSYSAQYTGVYYIAISKFGDAEAVNFHLYSEAHELQLEHQVASSSYAVPADSTSAISMGAVPWDNPTDLESFSSQGPAVDGSIIIIKPDLVAPDGVTSATYSKFYGTSASAPHAAGAAALVKERYPNYQPAQIQAFLETMAIDIGSAGKDNLYGSGRLHLGSAEERPLEVTTNPADNITTDSAILPGSLDSMGDYSTVNVSFVWGTEPQIDPTNYPNETLATPDVLTEPGDFTDTLGNLSSDTDYYFRAKATGSATVYGEELSFTTENVVAILSNLPPAVTNNTTVNITVGGDWVTRYRFDLNGAGYSEPVPVGTHITLGELSDGNYLLSVIGGDESGNWQLEANATTANWTVDTVKPAVDITSPENNLVTNKPSQTVEGTITDATAITGATLTLNDGEPQELTLDSDFSLEIELEEGENTILVSATDAAGNIGTANITATLNTASPYLISPIDGSSTTDDTPTFEWGHITGDIRYYHIQIAPDEAFTSIEQEDDTLVASTYNATALADGTWYWHVRWQDAQGNWSDFSETRIFTVSTQLLIVTITSPGDGAEFYTSSQTVSGNVTVTANITSATLTLNGISRTIPVIDGNFSEDVTLLPGPNTISVSASNLIGTGTSPVITATYVTRPVVEITSPADGSILATVEQAVTGTVSGQDITSCILYLNDIEQLPEVTLVDDSFTYPITIPGDEATIQVIATNAAGVGASPLITVKLDNEAPIIDITSPQPGDIFNNACQTLGGTVVDAPSITEATLILNGVSQTIPVESDNFTCEITLAEGENTIEVTATDTGGHTGSSGILTVTLDTTPPIISISSPANDTITSNAAQTITGTIDDPSITSATLTLNDGEPVAVTVVGGFFSQAVALEVASATVNTIVVSANDTAGNTGSSSIVISYDDEAPVVTVTSPSNGQTTGTEWLSVTGNISDVAGNATLTLNGVDQIALTLDELGRFGQGITLSPGTNTIEVTATDGLNTGSSGILTVILDRTAPAVVITSPAEGALLGTTNITVTGTIDDLSITSAMLTINGVDSEIEVSAGVFSQDVTLNSASATTNTILASAEDAYGNRGTSGTMVVEVDDDRPVVTITRPSSGLITNWTTLAVSGEINDPAIGEVTLTVNGNSEAVPVYGLEFGTTIPLSEGTNTIVVTATDSAKNKGSSGVITVTLDSTPPAIMLNSPADGLVVNTDEVLLSGTVDDPSVNKVILTINDDESQIIPAQAGSFRRTVSLPPNGDDYTISVSAMDRLGNQSTPVTRTVTLDAEAPRVTVTSIMDGHQTSDDSLEVIAEVTHDRGIASVELSHNGGPRQPMTEVASYAGNITLLAGDNTIEVFATDNSGSEGSSGIITVRLDTTAPTLTIGLSDPTDSILITVESEESLLGPPAVNINSAVAMTLIEPNKWSGTYPAAGTLAEGSYVINVTGTDKAGNETSGTATFCKETVTTDNMAARVSTDMATVEIHTTANVTGASISVTQHIKNPAENAATGEVEAGAFVEIVASGELRDSIEEVRIEVSYDPDQIAAKGIDEASLKLYLWNLETGQWAEVGVDVPVDSGVDMVNHIIWGVVDHLSTYGGFGAPPAPPATPPTSEEEDSGGAGGGGGGGGGPVPPGTTYVSDIITHEGRFTVGVVALSDDEACKLTIPRDTICLKANGVRPYKLTMVGPEEPPDAPEGATIIGLVYDLGPGGLTFEPSVNLTFTYNPDEVPEGVNEEKLVIVCWDTGAGEWVVLENCVVDPITHIISAPISHFTDFAVMARTRPAAFTISELTISPGEVNIGERVIINVIVTNDGDLTGSYEVALKVDDIITDTREITLEGGTIRKATFTTTRDAAGTYTVNVNGQTDTFMVIPPISSPAPPATFVEPPASATPPPEPPAPAPSLEPPAPAIPPLESPAPTPAINWSYIIGIIAVVVVIGGLLAYLLCRRRRTA